MSASGGGYTPPEFPVGVSPEPEWQPEWEPESGRPGRGLPPLGAAGVLAGVLAVGLVLVFTVGHPKSDGTSPAAQAGATTSVQVSDSPAAPSSSAAAVQPSSAASSVRPAPTDTTPATSSAAGGGGNSPEFYVGECVNTTGSGGSFNVDQASCSSADFRIIHAFPGATGNVQDDQSQCYAINGNDSEFENGDEADGYTLYCLNSLTGEYSPRRAGVNNCLDAKGAYEVDCTSSRSAWIVIGRIDGTTNTKNCAKYGSYDYSYYYTEPPQFVLCVNKYHH